jgi:cell shape-determining protein MreC
MSDQCKYCECRGDKVKCESTPCGHHENWYVKQVVSQLDKSRAELTKERERNKTLQAQLNEVEELREMVEKLQKENAALRGSSMDLYL